MDKQNYDKQDHLTSKDLLKVIIDITQHSATREELRETRTELREELQDFRSELKTDIENVRAELKMNIENVRAELKDTRTELRTDIQNLRTEGKHNMFWIIGTMIALMGLLPNFDIITSFFK